MGARTRASVVSPAIGVLVLALVLVAASAATARTFSPRPFGGGFAENPDGTWSLWGEDAKAPDPLHTYTAAEHSDVGQYYAALEEGLGSAYVSGADASKVAGISAERISASDGLLERLATGESYKSVPESFVGNDLVDGAVADGLWPSEEVVLEGTVATGSELVAPLGAAVAGFAIGDGVDELLGLPTLGSLLWDGPVVEKPERYYTHGFAPLPGGEVVYGHPEKCATEPYYEWDFNSHMEFALKGLVCGTADVKYFYRLHYFSGGEWHTESANERGPGSETELEPFRVESGEEWQCFELSVAGPRIGYPEDQPYHQRCIEYPASHGEAFNRTTFWDSSQVKRAAFPAKGLSGNVVYTPNTLPAPPPQTVPHPPKPDEQMKLPVVTYIAHERETHDLPGVEGDPVPSPLEIEIPAPERNELATHYVTRLHELGFTSVVEFTLPDTDTNPYVGPGEVAYTQPTPGSRVTPSTAISVQVNPEDAPPAIPPATTPGGLPELKLPKLGAVCRNFPFGVPCWLIQEFSTWSGTSSAPTFTVGAFGVRGVTIGPAEISLAPLEPIMSKVRPFMVLFSTVGLVLLFYKFATGGGPPSGGRSDSTNNDHEE